MRSLRYRSCYLPGRQDRRPRQRDLLPERNGEDGSGDPEALRHINRHPDGPHRGTGRLDPRDQIINRVNCIRAGFHFGSPALFSLSMIHMGREFHLSDDTILEQICKNFDLDQITAREYIDSFGK